MSVFLSVFISTHQSICVVILSSNNMSGELIKLSKSSMWEREVIELHAILRGLRYMHISVVVYF